MKRTLTCLIAALLCFAWCCPAPAESIGVLPAFVEPEGVTMMENEAWEKEFDGYSTRGWLLKGDVNTARLAIENYVVNLENVGFTVLNKVEPSRLDACYWFLDVDETGYEEAEINGYSFEVFVYGEVSKDGSQVAMMIGYVPGVEFQAETQWDSLFGDEETVWESAFENDETTVVESTGMQIPSFADYVGDAAVSLGRSGNADVYSMTIEHMTAVNDYIQLMKEYGLSGEDASEPEYGLPYYFWLENCEQEITPLEIILDDGAIHGYFVISIEPENDALIASIQYAEGLSPVDTGERWNGEVLSGEELDDVKAFLAEYEAADKIYTFSNEDIAQDVAYKLKKDVSEITWADVTSYEEVGVVLSVNIDYSDLAHMPALRKVSLAPMTSEVIDLSVLANCPNLNELNLIGGSYSGLDMLSSLKQLQKLSLSGTTIDDISWIMGMENLTEVSIDYYHANRCKITDFMPLVTLPNLKMVYMDEIPQSVDVSFLYGKGLEYVDTYGNQSTFDSWYEQNWDKSDENKTDDVVPETTEKPASTVSNRERCFTCSGDGRMEQSCSSCGGDGDRDCMSCYGKGYDNCSGCNGSGDRRCGRCYGTGDDSDGRCSNCYGTGRVRCSSCSGSGERRCSACSGSGDRDCSSCGGDGRTERSCTSCGGDGWR